MHCFIPYFHMNTATFLHSPVPGLLRTLLSTETHPLPPKRCGAKHTVYANNKHCQHLQPPHPLSTTRPKTPSDEPFPARPVRRAPAEAPPARPARPPGARPAPPRRHRCRQPGVLRAAGREGPKRRPYLRARGTRRQRWRWLWLLRLTCPGCLWNAFSWPPSPHWLRAAQAAPCL